MPIRPENRARYPRDWKEISLRIRAEAGQRCEWCGLRNGAFVVRDENGTVLLEAMEPSMALEALTAGDGLKAVRIVLTVAHLDHQPENVARENLKCLCQRCHLNYDRHIHAENRRRGIRERKEREGQMNFFGGKEG